MCTLSLWLVTSHCCLNLQWLFGLVCSFTSKKKTLRSINIWNNPLRIAIGLQHVIEYSTNIVVFNVRGSSLPVRGFFYYDVIMSSFIHCTGCVLIHPYNRYKINK